MDFESIMTLCEFLVKILSTSTIFMLIFINANVNNSFSCIGLTMLEFTSVFDTSIQPGLSAHPCSSIPSTDHLDITLIDNGQLQKWKMDKY